MDILTDIDEFCRENKIRYSICSGTLLGAVRHGGFIPWDDDADLFMPREDFDRFVESYNSQKYHLVYKTRNKEEFLNAGYAKVSDPATFRVNKRSKAKYGVFVDVFPLDKVPENAERRKKYMRKVMHYHNRLHHRQQRDLLSIIKSYSHSLGWWIKKCEKTIEEGRNDDTPLIAHLLGTRDDRTVIDRKRFDNMSEIEFEGRRFMAIDDPHSYLAMVYGDDNMTPPPPEKRRIHNEKIYRKEIFK